MVKCEHLVRPSLRGAGPCRIAAEVKLRNGHPNWWCRTHGLSAGAPDGSALETCPGAWFDRVADDECLELDLAEGEIAIWGAIPAAIEIGQPPDEPGSVHVHRRQTAGGSKDIDDSFEIVTLRNGGHTLMIEGTAAVAYSISELCGRSVAPLMCTHCGETHIDELKFATYPHRKHQCNACGRNFWDRQESISNPLADAHKQLGLPMPTPPAAIDRPLTLQSADYSAIAMFPSNAAIISSMSRPEEEGVHVHAWDLDGRWVVDETYFPVTLDGHLVDPTHLRVLAVQRALGHGAPVQSLECPDCGAPLTSPRDGWLEPTTQHICACGHTVKTRRRVFLNPLARLSDSSS